MERVNYLSLILRLGCASSALAMLAACGGGGNSGGPISLPAPRPSPTPSPVPTPTPTPSPTPTPTPTNFDTAEFRRSTGPDFHGAVTAWRGGVTGDGAIIAVIDTGIDSDSPEFAGRVHPNSADVASDRGIDGDNDHGTNVALIAAAARNNIGVLGIAYDAQILALRADGVGSCAQGDPRGLDSGCTFTDRDIAAGVNRAVDSGAAVINLSLGGSQPSAVLRAALQRAAAAGIVIVVAAGNDGDDPDAVNDPSQPDPFAIGTLAAGGANVIIVGSVAENNTLSTFSNAAGNSAASVLQARGERLCCIYENGELLVTIGENGGRFVTLFSGTSFSAPQVAGAVALLAQAFPNLTGAEIVQILLSSARDVGAAGVDAVFGVGVLDIAAAFAPQGATTLAGTGNVIAIGAEMGSGSAPMGDAFAQAPLEAVLLDKYDRAYTYDLGRGLRAAEQRRSLTGALAQGARSVSGGNGPVALAFTVGDSQAAQSGGTERQLQLSTADAQQARVLAARVALQISPQTKLAFAFRENAAGMAAGLQGQSQPAFLIARKGSGDDGMLGQSDLSFALRQQIGAWGITASADRGQAWTQALNDQAIRGLERQTDDVRSFGLAADRRFGTLHASAGMRWMEESNTILGARFADMLGAGGADSLFADFDARWQVANSWQLGGSWREGVTRAQQSGVIAGSSDFRSRAWAFDLTHSGAFQLNDSLGLRVSQPLRVTGGGLNLTLPITYDYASETARFGIRTLSLAPEGRELTGEIAWRGQLWNGNAAASVFFRHQPGHFTAAPPDQGVALKWNRAF